jgi:hypothetical protein
LKGSSPVVATIQNWVTSEPLSVSLRPDSFGDRTVKVRASQIRWSKVVAPAVCGITGVVAIACGFQNPPPVGTVGGAGGTSGGSGGSGVVGGQAPTTGGASTGGANVGGLTPNGGSAGSAPQNLYSFSNYQLTGTWPTLTSVVTQAAGTLSYTKIEVHNRFLAESCSIADYNKDGNPDVSSGRRWYAGPDFKTEHVFRDGHEDLPRTGDPAEIDTGVSDDWADFPWDVNGDSWPDIINIANCDVDPGLNVNPMPAPQTNATAYWYENPGDGLAGDPNWTPHLMHSDVRHEHKGLVDVNGDNKPELFAACKGCTPQQTKGFYSADWTNPGGAWQYTAVSATIEFPFGGTGWMHGLGFGDVNGDGLPDMLDRVGAWIQQPAGGWQLLETQLWDGDPAGNRGGAHMYTWDIDGDGDQDIFSADWAHGWGLAWYEQTDGMAFVKHKFMGSNDPAEIAMYGDVYFSEPHAAQVIDMDGDGVRDIVTGKMRFAHPNGYGDPDIEGTPFVYVFKTVQDMPGVSGAAHFEPYMVDNVVGVGRQFSVGHANTDGIMDICVGSKLGLYVFLGQ